MNNFGTAIILAGGKSSRMGFDKQFLMINEKRIIELLVEKLRTEFEEIIIVTNRPESYKNLKAKVTSDIIKQRGPLSGLHVGLKYSSNKYSYFIACDMPNINIEYIRYMKKRIDKRNPEACVTRFGNWIEAFNGFYSKDLYTNIEKHLEKDKRSVNSFLKTVDTLYIEEKEARKFSPNWDMFINLNTKDELNAYIKKISF